MEGGGLGLQSPLAALAAVSGPSVTSGHRQGGKQRLSTGLPRRAPVRRGSAENHSQRLGCKEPPKTMHGPLQVLCHQFLRNEFHFV